MNEVHPENDDRKDKMVGGFSTREIFRFNCGRLIAERAAAIREAALKDPELRGAIGFFSLFAPGGGEVVEEPIEDESVES